MVHYLLYLVSSYAEAVRCPLRHYIRDVYLELAKQYVYYYVVHIVVSFSHITEHCTTSVKYSCIGIVPYVIHDNPHFCPVGTQEGRYTKGGPLPTVNPIRRVIPPSIPLAKLGRSVTASMWQQTMRKYARQLIQGAG